MLSIKIHCNSSKNTILVSDFFKKSTSFKPIPYIIVKSIVITNVKDVYEFSINLYNSINNVYVIKDDINKTIYWRTHSFCENENDIVFNIEKSNMFSFDITINYIKYPHYEEINSYINYLEEILISSDNDVYEVQSKKAILYNIYKKLKNAKY